MGDFEPRKPALLATLVFLAAGLTVFWPILTGQFLAGPDSDQFVAGYGFRLFGAEYFREHGRIPEWNPYLFGGMPFIAAMHGDVFYPTAWLRWILPTDTAMNLGFAVHIVLAGGTLYAFLRALGVGWGAAVTGGVAYELSGIVAGLVNPGHDGKLFVSALTPLLFLAILRGVRDRRASAWGVLALVVGLSLHGHPQLSYYLLVAGALWGLWLLFLAPERPASGRGPIIAWSLAAVVVGFGLYAIQAMPFYQYIPFSPRAEGGPSGGWEYATAYSLPPSELISLVMPEFNGIRDAYWGVNPLKHHTEYVGVLPLLLAIIGLGDRSRRPVILALGGIGLLFLLISLGGHTPFYRLWYEVMPMMKKVRAPGMAFFLVAFPLSVFAGFGAGRLLKGEVPFRLVAIGAGAFGVLGLLGLAGVLQGVADALAIPQRMDQVMLNAADLKSGSLRVLLLALLALGAGWAVAAGKVRSAAAAGLLAAAVTADLWSVERRFFNFQPPAAVTYRDDEITAAVRRTPLPYRVLDAGVYRGSWLMAHGIPAVLGYHGNEVRFYDELLGGKNEWRYLGAPALWDLLAVQYLIVGQAIDWSGWSLIAGPVPTVGGPPGYLYRADAVRPWVRVVPAAAKVPEEHLVPTLLDPRFPADRIVLFPDTSTVTPAALGDSVPAPAAVTASLTTWEPGRLSVSLEGRAETPTWLLVSETWYPDWRATVDGEPAPVRRGQHALITVELPPGARQVELEFRSEAYRRGRLITFLSLAAALAMMTVPRRRRSTDANG